MIFIIYSEKYEVIPAEENDFPIRLLPQTLTSNVEKHYHEHIEMLYFTFGNGWVYCGGKEIAVKENMLITVNSNELHSITAQGRLDYYCMILNPVIFRDINNLNYIFPTQIYDDNEIKHIFQDIFAENNDREIAFDMKIKGQVYLLLSYLARNYMEHSIGSKEYAMRQRRLERLNDVIKYADAHFCDNITAKLLAQRCNMSVFYFSRNFKACTGKSVVEYVNLLRLEKAENLLRNTDITVTDAAMRTGFNDINYFCRLFKQIKGIRPGSLKKL